MTDTLNRSLHKRAGELAQKYTDELDEWVNQRVPVIIDNVEYLARCSALLIALNRQIARCAAAFGEANEVSEADMVDLVLAQFAQNFAHARAAVDGAGQAVM